MAGATVTMKKVFLRHFSLNATMQLLRIQSFPLALRSMESLTQRHSDEIRRKADLVALSEKCRKNGNNSEVFPILCLTAF